MGLLPGRGSRALPLGFFSLCSLAVGCGAVSRHGDGNAAATVVAGSSAAGGGGGAAAGVGTAGGAANAGTQTSGGNAGAAGTALSVSAGTGGNTAAAGTAGGSSLSGDAGASGASGAEATPPEPKPYRALAVSVTLMNICVLLDDHNIKCWGDNLYGQLGQENRVWGYLTEPQRLVNLGAGRTVKSVSVSRHASCALLDNGVVKCWGYSQQIGLDAPDRVGDEPGEMGDNLPALALGPGRTAQQLALGSAAGCAVLDDGNVRCWDLALHDTFVVKGSPVVELAAGFTPLARFADGSFGRADSSERSALPAGAHALQLAGEERQVCAVTDQSAVTCSDNFWAPPPLDSTSLVSVALFNGLGFCTLNAAGQVKCPLGMHDDELWAVPGAVADAYGLVEVNLGAKAVSLSGGGDHFLCAVLVDGNVKCFGSPEYIGSYLMNGQIQPINLGSH